MLEPPFVSDIKQAAHALIASLPEAADWDDIARALDEVRFREAVREGIAAAERGDFASPERVAAIFAKAGVKLAG